MTLRYRRSTCALIVGLALALCPTLVAANSEEPAKLPFEMATPEGWQTETIHFPLSFAPELDYEGIEELRFAPGWSTADSQDFWSYSFLWWIPSMKELDAETLGNDLVTYYRGLTSPAGKEGFSDEDLPIYEAELGEIEAGDSGRRQILGSVSTFDSFRTQKPIELNVRITIWPCSPDADSTHQIAYFELSPQPYQHEVWDQLAAIGQSITCK